jgi:hypothetical protein
VSEVADFESTVDSFRRQLQMLAFKVEQYCEETLYEPDDRNARLDLLDLTRIALELAGTVRGYVQSGEEMAYSVERRKGAAS